MIVSAVKTQEDFFKMKGQRITLSDAMKICQNNPFLKPIKGNNDKFKVKNDEEIAIVMAEMEQAKKDKDAKNE